jgi:sulfite reductase (NADPH) flavoprotein alpha-component
MHVALSRTPGNKKQYVQDKLHDQAASIRRLVLRENAHVYICGNAARMAKDVAAAMRGILAEDGETVAGVEEYLVEMKRTKRWCEDVW